MTRCRLIGLAIIVTAFAHGHVFAQTGGSSARVGPSFDCGAVHTPGAQLICSDDNLSRTDLIFVQAYYAMRQQVGPAGWQALKAEAVDFEDRTLQQCGVPVAGSLPPQPGPSATFVSAEYERQRAVWLSRLSGPAAEEARRPIEQHIELQRGLQTLGFLPPTEKIDGVYGAATRAGILAWQQSQAVPLTGFLGDADSVRLAQQVALAQPLPTPRTSPPPAMSASPSTVPATKERVPFGSHAGETAYVIKSEGVGTANASIQILMDWDRELRACSDEYLTYIPGEKNDNGYRECISYAKEHFSGPEVRTARANCQTGEMWSFWATAPRFYVGQIKQAFEASTYSKGGIYYSHVFQYEGFRIPDIGATNVAVDGEVFRRLCPTSFTEPPETDLPELDLSADCQGMLADAERTATEAGMGHVLNIRIIDAWDVKRESSSEYESKCSAKILLNTGGKGLLEYKEIPLHGKYFIQTNIVP
jgi:hypothetical protein